MAQVTDTRVIVATAAEWPLLLARYNALSAADKAKCVVNTSQRKITVTETSTVQITT